MLQIKRIRVLSAGKVLGAVYAFIGLLVGALVTIVSIIGAAVEIIAGGSGGGGIDGVMSIVVGIGSLIFFPIVYGALGFIAGVLVALVYNLVARWVGGLEVETQ